MKYLVKMEMVSEIEIEIDADDEDEAEELALGTDYEQLMEAMVDFDLEVKSTMSEAELWDDA